MSTMRRVLTVAAGSLAALPAYGSVSSTVAASSTQAASYEAARVSALDASAFKPFKVKDITPLTHDTKRFTFQLPAGVDAGCAPASVLVVKGPTGADGKPAIRPYTPTSAAHELGSFELVVKVYPTGVVSKYFGDLKVGDEVEIKGPIKKFDYVPNTWNAIGMIAGGSGITPMLQLIRAILDNPRDKTEVRLLFANKTPADVILKAELDALAAVHPNFKVTYIVDAGSAGADWKGETGVVSKEMVMKYLPPANAEGAIRIFVCGPPGMMKHLSGEKKSPADQGDLTGLLADMRYTKEQVYKY